jgi:hypothetical protein
MERETEKFCEEGGEKGRISHNLFFRNTRFSNLLCDFARDVPNFNQFSFCNRHGDPARGQARKVEQWPKAFRGIVNGMDRLCE